MRTRLWNGLLALAKRIGQVQAWLILSAFYFVVMAPAALLLKLTSDPLRVSRRAASVWHDRPRITDRMAWARSQ